MSSGITGTFAKPRQVGTPLFLCPGYVTYLFLTRSPLNVLPLPSTHLVRLACLSHAASVRSEPGSNSSLCIVGTAPANRNGVAYEKKGSYTHLLRSEDMLRRRAGQSPTRLHTDCLDRLQTAVMPQAPFATALAASHPHNRLHCLLVKEQFGDDKLPSPRHRIAFGTERTTTHNTKQISPVQRIAQLIFRNCQWVRPEVPLEHGSTLISLLRNRLCTCRGRVLYYRLEV